MSEELKNGKYEETRDVIVNNEDAITRMTVTCWYLNGNLHREDGPAIEWTNGRKDWYKNGLRHREDGPAKEYANGSKEWWINGEFHREGGPAVEWFDDGICCHKEWYRNGLSHREDGPAVEESDGSKEWWIDGVIQKKLIIRNYLHDDRIEYYKDGKLEYTESLETGVVKFEENNKAVVLRPRIQELRDKYSRPPLPGLKK